MNWEPVLTDLFSEFPVVADAAEQVAAHFSHLSAVPVLNAILWKTFPVCFMQFATRLQLLLSGTLQTFS
jgi:hypothetical protein